MKRFAAYVWWCGDEDCNCYQARIIERNMSGSWPRGLKQEVWKGSFCTGDAEDFPGELATAELNRAAKALRRVWNDAYHSIEWPWDRRAEAV